MEKVSLIELDWDIDAAIASGAKFEKQAIGLKAEMKDLKEEFKKGAITSDEYAKKNVQLNASLKNVQKEQRISTKVIQTYSDQQNKSLNIIKQTDGSINQLQAALGKNRSLYRDLTKEQRENAEVGGVLLKTIEAQDKEYKELQTNIGVTAVNVGDYRNQLEGLVPGLGAATGGVQKLLTVSKAFIASPLGLVIGALGLALGALTSYFTGTERGAQKFRVITATLSGVLGTFTDIAINAGEALFNAISSPREAFESLKEKAKEIFLEFIPNAIRKVIDGFGLLGTAIKKVFEGDFDGALTAAAEGLGKLGDGFTDLNPVSAIIKNIGEELKTVGEEAIRDAKAAAFLADQLNKIKVAERELGLERAIANKTLAEQKLIVEDVTKSTEERIEAAQRAFDLENDLLQKELEIQRLRVSNIAKQNALSESTEEDIQAEYDARIALANLEQQSFSKQVEIQNKLNILRNEQLKKDEEHELAKKDFEDRLRLTKEEEEAQREAIEFDEKLSKIETEREQEIAKAERQKQLELKRAKEQITNAELLEKQKALITDKYEDIKNEIRLKAANNEIELVGDVFGVIAGLVGEQTALGKIAASAVATIDTFVAANKALRSTDNIFVNFALTAATIAKGLSNVVKINRVDTSVPAINKPKGFATGGYVGSDNMTIPTQPNGDNVLATLKRGEVVLNESHQKALGGHQTFRSIGVPGFATSGRVGGSVSTPSIPQLNTDELAQKIGVEVGMRVPKTILVESINTAVENLARIESEATI